MKHLQASITVRILDSLGVVSREMPDIRESQYLVKPKIWSGKVELSENDSVVFLYSEDSDMKFMITKFISKASTESYSNWYCFVCGDIVTEDPELNKMFSSYTEKNNKFREVSFFEMANILRGFEMIRTNMPYWLPNKPTTNDIDSLSTFINSLNLNIENTES